MDKVRKLQNKISELYIQIKDIQDKCSHPEESLIKKNCADTGNYDPSQDKFWIEYHCLVCDKRWDININE